jgi:hypothetical protein
MTQVPDVGKIYSFNEGNYEMWDEPTKAYISSLKDPSQWGGKPYSSRYIGSLVSQPGVIITASTLLSPGVARSRQFRVGSAGIINAGIISWHYTGQKQQHTG